jgi:hypothetical protein
VAAVTHGQVLQPAVDDEIDERGAAQDGIRHEVPAEPVEEGADEGADDDDGQAQPGIEVLAQIEIPAAAERADINGAILSYRR